MKHLLLFCALLTLLVAPYSAKASTYTQPYTESFTSAYTGLASSVVIYVFDANGVCRVGPASYVNASGTTVTGPNNEPTITESGDASATANTGAYFENLPLDTIWGSLHFKAVITGKTGVVAESSISNLPVQSADQQANSAATFQTQGYTNALATNLGTTNSTVASNLNATVSSRSTYAGGAVASVTAPVSVGSISSGTVAPNGFLGGSTSSTPLANILNGIASGSVNSVSQPVTVTNTVNSNITQIAGQTVTAPTSGGVAFPSVIGTSVYAGGPVAAVTGSVGSISGITFPSNFGTFSVDSSGRVTLVPGQNTVASNFIAAPTTTQIAAVILKTPANLLVTDTNGYVTYNNSLPTEYLSTNEQTAVGNLDAKVSSRLAATAYIAPNNPATVSLSSADELHLANADTQSAALPSAATIVSTLLGTATITIPSAATTTGTAETLTYKQLAALQASLTAGSSTQTVTSTGSTNVVNYYLVGQPITSANLVAVVTTSFSSSLSTTGRIVKVAQPFPAVS